MLSGVTRHMLCHLAGVPHLHVNRPLITVNDLIDAPSKKNLLSN